MYFVCNLQFCVCFDVYQCNSELQEAETWIRGFVDPPWLVERFISSEIGKPGMCEMILVHESYEV